MPAAFVAFVALFALLGLALAGMVYLAMRDRAYGGGQLRGWTRGLLLMAIGWPLFLLRELPAGLWAVAGGSALLLAGYGELGRALEQHVRGRSSPRLVHLAALALGLVVGLSPLLGWDDARRVSAFWTATFAVALWFGFRLRDALRTGRWADVATMVVFLGAGVAASLRLLEQLFSPRGTIDTNLLTPGQALALGYFLIAPVLASVGFLLMHVERHRQRLELAAACDLLTGAYNRNGFMQHAARAMRGARRERQPMALMMIDVDHFKRINDAHGHPAGDAVLASIAHTISEAVRPTDLLGRFGGDEFVLLCAADAVQAHAIAERIGFQVRRHPVAHGGGAIEVTVSIGVAATGAEPETLPALLKRADARLYEAKRAGRDRAAADVRASAP